MEAMDLEPVMRDALTKGDPKAVLSIMLAVLVMILRERTLAHVKTQNAFGRAARWLGTTHLGGVVSSIVGSGLGAVITALSTKTWPRPGVIVNVFLIGAAASGFATWTKWRKQTEDKAKLNEPVPPPPPPSSSSAPLVLMILAALGMMVAATGCQSLRDGLTGFKGEASYAVLEGARETLRWDRNTQIAIAKSVATREEGEKKLREQQQKRDEILDGFASAADALRVFNDALASYDAGKARDWGKLARAIIDALSAVRSVLERHGVKIPLPALALPGGLK